MRVLVVNAGSSSLKLRVLDADDRIAADATLPPPAAGQAASMIDRFLSSAPEFDAAGHRVVHGGAEFTAPVVLADEVEAALDRLSDLAPLHNGPALEAMRAVGSLRPDVRQVACFDTAFHAGLPPEASTYALPHAVASRWGLRRFGFHGLSHAWAAARMAQLMGRPPAELRLVTAHLGAGASLAAVQGGRSIDTTMGFTPLEGLVMATRSGSVDPGLVLWLQRHAGLGPAEVEDLLEHQSGLLGLSGVSGDLHAVIEAADAGHAGAALAFGVYVYRLRVAIAAMAGALGGIDGLAFTGGAGEHSPRLRAAACVGLGFLGIALDGARNQEGSEGIISAGSGPAVAVIEAREDLEIAHQVRTLLRG